MISLEKAKALKEVGLKWEPKLLDIFTMCAEDIEGIEPYTVCVAKTKKDVEDIVKLLDTDKYDMAECIWLPRLDQLLGEIERQEWEIRLIIKKERTILAVIGYGRYHKGIVSTQFKADTPEDAAAEALLWIKGQDAWK